MFGDFGKMLKLVGEIKTKIPEIKTRMAATEFSAATGGGAVSVTVTGNMRVAKVEIKRDLLVEQDAAILQDLVIVATNLALDKAGDALNAAMNEVTGGLNIPGLEGLLG